MVGSFLDRYRQLKQNDDLMPIIIMLTTSINPNDQLKAEKLHGSMALKTNPSREVWLNK